MITRRDFLKITAASGALASFGNVAEAKESLSHAIPDNNLCMESRRRIPLLKEVDIVVAGGSSRAVASAVAASKMGCSVFLVGYQPYLGEDICGSLFFDKKPEEEPNTFIARKLFTGKELPTPQHIKKTLEDELIDNQVQFLYSSYVTNVLVDPAGKPAGVVIANRSGRQAIRCKAIIDATHQASVSEMIGVRKTDFKATEQEFIFTVVGNEPKEAQEIILREQLAQAIHIKDKKYPVTRYTFKLPVSDNSYETLAGIEQTIRDKTWDIEQVDSADLLWYIPQQTIVGTTAYRREPKSLREIPVTAFQPQQTDNIWVLGPCADISRELSARIMRPIPSLFIGEIIGTHVANASKKIANPKQVRVYQSTGQASDYGEVCETLSPLRPLLQKEFIDSPAGSLPVIGAYDVVVLGGGTAGASAGISAAKHGAKTLVVEYLHGLGGLSTLGMIGVYWDGFREGYTAQIDKAVTALAPKDHPRQPNKDGHFLADWKMEWHRRELLKAGGKLWFGVIGCGALKEGNTIKGIVVATPFGRGVIRSKLVIDSTGSADVAIAAGAGYGYTGKDCIAVQGAGTGKWAPGDHYNNNDWLFVDDTDILDVSRAFVQAKHKQSNIYDIVKMPQTRERRRMVGEYTISVYDVIHHRRYADTISYHRSSFDTHGMIVDPYFILNPPEKRHTIYDADVPLRCLLPKGIEGLIVTGLGASAHRDAMPVIRMQPCLQNQGYAVGYLAAKCIKENKTLRKVNIKEVQKHLVKIGNLPARVLTDKEFKGFSNKEMRSALISVTDNYKGLEVLLTDKPCCIRLVKEQMDRTEKHSDKVLLAGILCFLGEKSHLDILKEAVQNIKEWDEGWHYTGMGQFGMCLSRLDAQITALGNTRSTQALPAILEKAALLEPEDYMSHFRAISMATEAIGSSNAAPVLATMLTKPGVQNHAIASYTEARNSAVPDFNDTSTRNLALKELFLAKALYVCGDKEGIGKQVLMKYANGLQGHYARFAYETLNS